MKNLKVINMKKFIRSITILSIIVIGIIFLLSKVSLSHNEKAKIDYDTITVIQGDTLWNIASEQQIDNPYFENKDVRDIIYQIKKINQLENSSLQIGQKLQVPII